MKEQIEQNFLINFAKILKQKRVQMLPKYYINLLLQSNSLENINPTVTASRLEFLMEMVINT